MLPGRWVNTMSRARLNSKAGHVSMNRCNKVEYDIDYMTRTLHVHACHADENRATQHGGDDERGLALTWPVHRGAHTHVSSQQCRGCAGSRDRGRCGVPARGQPHARKAEVRAKWRGVGVECACGEGGGSWSWLCQTRSQLRSPHRSRGSRRMTRDVKLALTRWLVEPILKDGFASK